MQLNFGSYYIMPIHPKNGWDICNFAVTNEDRLKRYLPGTLKQNLTPSLSTIFVEKKVKQFESKDEFLFTLKEKNSNKLVGLIFIKEIDWNKKQGEFAYCTDYTLEGKGVITTAIKQLSKYAFKELDLETLQIIVHKSNIGSIKVAKNNNFAWIKTLNNEFTTIGESSLNMELYELYHD